MEPSPVVSTTTISSSDTNTTQTSMEISRMLQKLRTLVPGIPPEQKMSKLEIMQHVIDYINELATELDQQQIEPDSPTSATSTTTTADESNHRTEMVN